MTHIRDQFHMQENSNSSRGQLRVIDNYQKCP
uniref:Uncharacterized protein n=1 Tax=Anguilla anguilla TaxID=7936 RepID=A0A0E9XQF2_ANGAN